MIQDKYKDHLHFGYYLDGDYKRIERKLIEFRKQGGGTEIDFGLFLVADPNFVKGEFLRWERS